MERVLGDPRALTGIDIKVIAKNRLTKRTNTVQSQIVKTVEPIFEDTLQVSYFSSYNGFTLVMFYVIEQVMGEVVWSCQALRVWEGEMRSLPQQKLSGYYRSVSTVLLGIHFLDLQDHWKDDGPSHEGVSLTQH